MRVWGLEKRCKLPSGVWVGAEAEIDFGYFSLRILHLEAAGFAIII